MSARDAGGCEVITAFDNRYGIIVAFQGTYTDFKDWIADIKMGFKQCPFCKPGSKVHAGGLTYYYPLRNRLKSDIAQLLNKYGENTRVIFTGHSLGGMLTTIASIDQIKSNS